MVTPIRVGTTGDYAPFSTTRSDGAFTGFDIELVELLARTTVTFVALTWSEIEAALASSRVDLVASGITITQARKRNGLFSRCYLRNHTVVMGRAAAALPPQTLGVNRGGYLETVARSRFPSATIVTVTDNARLPERLMAGDFDAFMSDAIEARKFSARQPVTVLQELEAQEHALLFRKDLAALQARFDTGLDALLRTGTLARLAAAHGIDSALVPAP
jgi:ABC-type amino acid transport substrate-binding protein